MFTSISILGAYVNIGLSETKSPLNIELNRNHKNQKELKKL